MENKKLNLAEIKSIHFIGIGGIGISALAALCLKAGKKISGTNDILSPQTLYYLRGEGVDITLETDFLPEADLYVFSEAWRNLFPELLEKAFTSGKPCINYFEGLGLFANEYFLLAVAGTHGKTTTTAMLTDILEEADFDPTVVVGSLRSKTGKNFREGKSRYAVVEACEYREDFLFLEPDILVITNLDLDHVDYYKDLAAVQASFNKLAKKVPETGFIIADISDEKVKPALEGVKAEVVDYRKFFSLNLELKQPGIHNLLNAAAAKAAAAKIGIKKEISQKALKNFSGTKRRFEYKGEFKTDYGQGVLYDDYAHHPTEILATISGAREIAKDKTLTVVFESHTYTRTEAMLAEFAKALAKADKVIVLPIHSAREENLSGISNKTLAGEIIKEGISAGAVNSLEMAAGILRNDTEDGGVVITMGAGYLAPKLAEKLLE